MGFKTCFTAMTLAASAASCALPPSGGGWYAGASAGTGVLELERGDGSGTAFAFDEEDTAWKVYGGYLWDLPYVHLGVEGGYVDLGDPPAAFPDLNVLLEASGFDLWGVAGIDVGPVRLFGKLGGILWSIDGSTTGATRQTFDEEGFDLATGFGVSARLGAVELRGEVESFAIEDTRSVELYSLGVAWRF